MAALKSARASHKLNPMEDDISEHPDSNTETTSPQSAPRAVSLDRERLKDGVKSTGLRLWSVIGVMATMGGVLGLYQFFNASDVHEQSRTDTLLIAMVAEGVISEDQAQNLIKILDDRPSDVSVEETISLETAVEEQDKDAIIAMATMLTRDTYTEGLDLLEDAAETSADWLELSELSLGRDRQRSLRAAEKAVALDPENFRAITMLVQAQSAAGNYPKAIRSAEAARIIASTPRQRLMAESAIMNTYFMARDVDKIESAIEGYQSVMDAFEQTVENAPFTDDMTREGVRDHPAWTFSTAKSIHASAFAALENYDRSLSAIDQSKFWLDRLKSHANAKAHIQVRQREIMNIELLASIHIAKKDKEATYQAFEEIIDARESLIRKGDAASREALAIVYAKYGQAAFDFGDKDKANELYRTGYEAFKSLVDENPDNEELKSGLDVYENIIVFLEAGDDSEAYKTDSRAKLQQLRQELMLSPDDDELQRQFLAFSATYSAAIMMTPETGIAANEEHIAFVIDTANDVQAKSGGSYFSHLLKYHAEFQGALVDTQQGDDDAARAHYTNMLNLYDLIISAPDIESYSPEVIGTELYGLKLGTLRELAKLGGDGAIEAARSGLAISEGLNDSGQLKTADQAYPGIFRDLIAELEEGTAVDAE